MVWERGGISAPKYSVLLLSGGYLVQMLYNDKTLEDGRHLAVK